MIRAAAMPAKVTTKVSQMIVAGSTAMLRGVVGASHLYIRSETPRSSEGF